MLKGYRWTGVSLLLCAVAGCLYGFRPVGAYALTVYPAWVPAFIGLGLAVAARPKPFLQTFRWPFVAWLLFTMAFSEEAHTSWFASWPTPGFHAAHGVGKALRVISLNCAGGNPEAAAEVGQYQPDIVLLQESPSRAEVQKLAIKLFREQATTDWGVDGSVIFRGKLEALPLPRGTSDFVAAIGETPGGMRLMLVSLRLTPPVLRFDYFSPDCWSDYAANLLLRQEQLRRIVAFVQVHRGNLPLIMGGDFNAGPSPQLSSVMPADMSDSFRQAGIGWPHTAVNEFPLVRIDQVWCSSSFKPDTCVIRRTENSDHRMMIADLMIK